jgi:hypothetical protein
MTSETVITRAERLKSHMRVRLFPDESTVIQRTLSTVLNHGNQSIHRLLRLLTFCIQLNQIVVLCA